MTVRRYQLLSRCNQAVIHATAEQPLYESICQLMVDVGGYALAWIGLAQLDMTFQVAAVVGENTESIIKATPTWDVSQPSGSGPTGTAFRTHKPVFVNDLSHAHPYLKHMPTTHTTHAPSFNGMACLPLLDGERALGVAVVYTYASDGFDDDEQAFLSILVEDMAFGVKVLRERRQREAAERRLQAMFDLAGDAIITVTDDQRITFFNQTAERMFGYSAAEVIGQPMSLLMPDRFRAFHTDLFRRFLLENRPPYSSGSLMTSMLGRRRDGTEFAGKASVAYFRDNEQLLFIVIVHDETETQRFTQALAQKEQELRMIIDAVPHGVFIRDRQGVLLLANKALADAYGLKAEDLIGKNYRELHPIPAEVERFLADDQAVLRDLKTRVAPSVAFTLPNGTECVHQVVKVPVYLATRSEYAVLGVAVDITLLKHIEQTLATSRDMLEAIFANAPIGIAMLYEEQLVWANPGLCNMIEVPPGAIHEVQLAGLFASEVAYQTTRDILFRPTQGADRYREIESEWRRRSGVVFPCFLRLTRLDERTSVMMAMDVTETRASIEALQESLQRYHLLFDGAPDGILILNQDGYVIEANMSMAEMLGYERHDLLDRHPAEFSPPHQPDGNASATQAARYIWSALSGKPQSFEWLHQRRDGSTFYAEVHLHTLELNGELLVQAIVHDIDERKQAEARFSQIFRSSPDPITISSLKSGFYYDVNDAFLELTGLPREAIIGHHVSELGIWRDLHDREQLVAHVNEQGAVRGVEVAYVRPDGSTGIILMSAEVLDLGGPEPYLLTLGKDITARVEGERALRERDQLEVELTKAREMTELKSRFVTLVSHEFRTPLATILAAASNLQRYFDRMTGEQRDKHFHKISAMITGMTKILDDILMVGHADSGMLFYAPQAGNIATLCGTVLDEIRAAHDEEHRLLCSFTNPPAAPVLLDEKLLRQILLNLITNALKFSTAPVTCDLGYSAGWLTVVVADTGVGIPEVERETIFEAFQRGTNIGTTQGTGLGLTVTKLAVDLYGGTISFDSAVGVGTTFTVRLPMPLAG